MVGVPGVLRCGLGGLLGADRVGRMGWVAVLGVSFRFKVYGLGLRGFRV